METNLGSRERSVLAAIFVLAIASPTHSLAQGNDFCDCNDRPSLGSFVTSDAGTYPPEIPMPIPMFGGTKLTIPLPEDGVLVFDNFTADGPPSGGGVLIVEFTPNEANTPVRLLVKGNFTLESNAYVTVEGGDGTNGSSQNNGKGGLPGPGGFRGGDGGSGALVSATRGGPGQGPAGGAAGTPDLPVGQNDAREGEEGRFSGSETLFPLIGGSGGGGGSGTGNDNPSCTGAGGGGGAGAIIIAANGKVRLDGRIFATGGDAGPFGGDNACSGGGGDGGPGVVRIIANEITGGEAIFATTNSDANAGVVRLEVVTYAYTGMSRPEAVRDLPGPVFPVLEPSLAITSIDGQSVSLANGQPISELPKGNVGEIDILTTSFDPITVQLASQNIPSNTTVEVMAKPRTGNSVVQETATLGGCDGSGACTASVDLNLAPGVYFVEAQATFQAAGP